MKKDIEQLTIEDCITIKNNNNKSEIVNPLTGRKIKTNGSTYSMLINNLKIKEQCAAKQKKSPSPKKKVVPSPKKKKSLKTRLDDLHHKFFGKEKQPYIIVKDRDRPGPETGIASISKDDIMGNPQYQKDLPVIMISHTDDFIEIIYFITSDETKSKVNPLVPETHPAWSNLAVEIGFPFYFYKEDENPGIDPVAPKNYQLYMKPWEKYGRKELPGFLDGEYNTHLHIRMLLALASLGTKGTIYEKNLDSILRYPKGNFKGRIIEKHKADDFVIVNSPKNKEVLSDEIIEKIEEVVERISSDILNDETNTWENMSSVRDSDTNETPRTPPSYRSPIPERKQFSDSVKKFMGLIRK